MVFEVDFWGHGIEVHFDGEETPIAIYGGDRGFAIRTWTYPNHPDGDAPIVEVYKKYGLKRRFRRVEDGLWIFGQKNVPCGIFINKRDYLESGVEWTINNFLKYADDRLYDAIEGED